MNILAELFITFAQIGGLTFGGGYAMLPLLQREVVEHKHWATEEELMDYYAIGQCTPGIIAVNTATFIGFKTAGTLGGIIATLGVIFPSWVIITVIALFIQNFAKYTVVQHALKGIMVCVFVLILDAVLKLGKKSVKDIYGLIVFLLVFALSMFTDISSPVLVIASGFLGIIFSALKAASAGKEAK